MSEITSDPAEPNSMLISVRTVAKILGISTRSVWRLHSTGKIIAPVRLGGLVRWNSDELTQWIKDGCPDPSPVRRKPR